MSVITTCKSTKSLKTIHFILFVLQILFFLVSLFFFFAFTSGCHGEEKSRSLCWAVMGGGRWFDSKWWEAYPMMADNSRMVGWPCIGVLAGSVVKRVSCWVIVRSCWLKLYYCCQHG